jgi:sensor histidine kinase YesM
MLKFIIKSKHFLKGKKIEERNYPNIRLYEGLYYNNCIHNEKKALLLIESSLNEYISKNDLAGIASTYSLLGDMFTNKNILDKAMSYYKRALNIRIQSDDKNSMSILWTNIAHVYMLKKDYNNALKCNFKSFKVRLRTGNKQLIASSYANIGSTYIKMRHYDRALIYLNKGLLLARELGVNLYIKNSYKKLFELFYEQKNYQKALEYHQLLSDIMLKIAKEENNRKIAEIQSKYENEKKQQQLKNLSKQNSIQKLILRKRQNLVYGLSFSFILIILLAILYSRHNKLKSAQKTLELEQKLLRSQMNPHFIFNSLSSIQSYILKNDLFEAGKYLSGFAKLIRLVLTNSREEFIPLENEIQTLKLYLLLQTLRFENKFDYSFEIDPAIDPEKKYIPPMLIQPLVENAIDHGILNKQDKGNIFIRIFMGNEIMQIEVEDNGIGRKKANLIQEQNKSLHKSLSTKITNERIQLLNKKYKLGIRLTIYDLHDKEGIASGTLVRIIIPSKRLKFIIKNRDFVLFSLLSKSYRSNKM